MSPLTFSFAAAVDEDLLPVQALVQSAYRDDPSQEGWTTEANLLTGQRVDDQMLRDLLDEPEVRILLAREGEQVIACCELREPDDTGATYLGMFAVAPRLQDLGLGSLVLAEAERIATEDWGAQSLRITVIDLRGELIDWYERRGFTRTGEVVAFPDDPRFGIPLRDDLQLAVLSKPLAPAG